MGLKWVFGLIMVIIFPFQMAVGQDVADSYILPGKTLVIIDASGTSAETQDKSSSARILVRKMLLQKQQNLQVMFQYLGQINQENCQVHVLYVTDGQEDENRIQQVIAKPTTENLNMETIIQQEADALMKYPFKIIALFIGDTNGQRCQVKICPFAKNLTADMDVFHVHTIGYDVDQSHQQDLQCFASALNGRYTNVQGIAQLQNELSQIWQGTKTP